MINTFYSVLPIFLVIMVGVVAKLYLISDEGFWRNCEKLTYYVLFPSLLILKLSHADFNSISMGYALSSIIIATLVVGFILIVFHHLKGTDNPLFTSVFQGGIRYNSYVFIAMSSSLFGDVGITLSAIIIAYMIIITNFVSVTVLGIYGTEKASVKTTVISVMKNPLILAALTGALFAYFKVPLNQTVENTMAYIGHAALPLSLLSVGAGLKFSIGKNRWLAVISSSAVKLLALPAIAISLLTFFGVTGTTKAISVLYAAVPCAGNAYILARQMGGDAEVMASIITMTTLMSILTMPFIMLYA